MTAAGLVVSFLSGTVWGVTFWSWGLPLPIPFRVLGTVLLLTAMSAASRAGTIAAAAFALGMGASSALLLAMGGQLFVDWWALVPAGALLAGVSLSCVALLREARLPEPDPR